MNLLTIARAIRSVSLGVWLGSAVMVFVMAPIVFQKLDRSKAGEVVGVAVISEGIVWANDAELSGWRRYVPAAGLGGAVLILLVLVFWIGPEIEALRVQIGEFTAANADTPERLQFRKLHGASMGLSLLQTILVAVALIAGMV